MNEECEKFARALSAYADGEKDAPGAESYAEVEAHVKACPACSALVEEYRRLDALARESAADLPREERWNEVRRALEPAGAEATRNAELIRRRRFVVRASIAGVFAAAAAILITFLLPSSGKKHPAATELTKGPDSEVLEVDPDEGYSAFVIAADDGSIAFFVADTEN